MKCPRSTRVILALAALSIVALPLVALAQSSQPSASGQAAPEKSAPAQATPTQATPAPAAQATPAKSAPTASTSKSGMSKSAKKDEVQRQLKMMSDQLKLTPDQRDKCKAILTDNAAQLKQMHAKYAGMEKNDANKAAMKKDMADLRDASDAKMAEVLSADQMTQYKAMREAQMAKMKQNMAGREHKEGEDDHK